MENPKDVRDVKDKVIGYIEGYKHIQFIMYCLERGDRSRLSEIYTPTEVHFLMMSYYYAKYQMDDYYYYTRLKEAIESGPLLNYPHDIDIEAYIKGIYERNSLVWLGQKMKEIFYFVKDKKVLDFGCGSGFYSILFDALGATTFSYDRKDVAEVVKKWKPHLHISTMPFAGLFDLIKDFDVIWLSEVLHGKSEKDREVLLRSLTIGMRPRATLAINELKPKTVLSQLFDYQMKIHCEGKLIDRKDIAAMVEMLPLDWYNTITTDYHMIYLLRKEG